MAVLYFTSNADSGDGTLRDVMTNANDGDIITFDPATFTETGDIVIALSSGLPLRAVTIRGAVDKRIILDRQGNGYFFRVTSSGYTMAFENVDFKNGYRTSSNESPFYIGSANTTVTFTNCKFYGNTGAYSGFLRGVTGATGSTLTFNNCVAWDNTHTNSSYSASVFTFQGAADPIITLNGCTFDTDGEIPFLNPGSYTRTNCLFNGVNDWQVDFSTVGFVNRSGNDYRLAAGSAYLTGGSTTGADILGHTRTGSWGAYDGSWLVSPFTVSQDTTVNYADIQGAGTIADGAVVKVGKLYAAGGSVSASGRAYFCADTLTGLTFTNVVAATPSGVSAIAASIAENVATVDVTATGTGYVVEFSDDLQSWTTLSLNNGKATLSNSNALYFRVFDGGFLRSEIVPRYYYYQGAASGGSFATASDWSLDKAGAIALSSKPTISGCYFDCRK